MRVLHFDWETDGLNISGQPSDHPDQPGSVSLSAILDDSDGNTIDSMDTLIIPVRPIPPDVVAIHGITTEMAQTKGINIADAIDQFAGLAQQADVLSAFNFFFDFKMAKIGCARSGEHGEQIRQMLESKSSICTMDGARKHLGTGRFCKLSVAHERLLGQPHTRAHDSMADALASRSVYYRLRDLGALPEPKLIGRKTYSTPPSSYTPAKPGTLPDNSEQPPARPSTVDFDPKPQNRRPGKPGKISGF